MIMITNPIYQPYNMMNLNYINAMKNRNIISNAYIPLNNNKNSNFCSEAELANNQVKPTTHRVFNKFNFQNQNKK